MIRKFVIAAIVALAVVSLALAVRVTVTGSGSVERTGLAAPAAATPLVEREVGAPMPAAVADTTVARFAIAGMTCGSCARTAQLALRRLEGVYSAEVSYDSASAVVRYDGRRVHAARIAEHLERMTGYRATLVSAESPSTSRS